MNRQPILEGERLLLRPLVAEDWAALYRAASDPLIWAIHPAHDRWQEPVFRAFFDDALAQAGALAVIDKANGVLVGSSRFQNHDPAQGGSIEIGWTFLARSHWGAGYNAEMKRMMLGHALRAVMRVRFVVGAGNLRSCRAMEKIGGRLTGVAEVRMMAGQAVSHVIYEVTRGSFASGPLS